MADTLLVDAQALENAAQAYSAASAKAVSDAAVAAASMSASNQAHADLQAAIAVVVGDAQALDPAVQSSAPAAPAAPAAPPAS